MKLEPKKGISVIIISLNEIKLLPNCVQSIQDWVDEIIVVDSGSTDGTLEYCREHPKITLFNQAWLGYGPQKNYALKRANYEWVLSLDADECATESLGKELKNISRQNPLDNGYQINRSVVFFGKKLRFGGFGREYLLRFFRRDHTQFTDAKVHEKAYTNGSIGTINKKYSIVHIPYDSYEDYFNKFNKYTSIMAKEHIKDKKVIYSPASSVFRFLFEFFKRYFLLLGVLDGFQGFFACTFAAYYRLIKYLKIAEHKN